MLVLSTLNTFILLVFMNLINFCDRGIIPGSYEEFADFVSAAPDSLQISPSAEIGFLQSAFVIGLIFGFLFFSQAIHRVSDIFLLTGLGCALWLFAVFLSALAYYTRSFLCLFFARMLSGLGEASLQTTIPPWIQACAPPGLCGSWLAIFYTAIPVGTAIGYAYSAMMSQAMEPVYVCIILAYAAQVAVLMALSTFGSAFLLGLGYFDTETQASTIFGILASAAGVIGTPIGGFVLDMVTRQSQQRRRVGEGEQVGVMEGEGEGQEGNSSHGDLEKDEKEKEKKRLAEEENGGLKNSLVLVERMEGICLMLYWTSLIGMIFLCCTFFAKSAAAFFLLITIGCTFLFMTTGAITLAVMTAVPMRQRALAIALLSISGHIFGDVPSPSIAGLIKDSLAPHCASDSTSSECRDEGGGLRWCILVCVLWLYWTVVFFAAAWFCNQRYLARRPSRLSLCSTSEKPNNLFNDDALLEPMHSASYDILEHPTEEMRERDLEDLLRQRAMRFYDRQLIRTQEKCYLVGLEERKTAASSVLLQPIERVPSSKEDEKLLSFSLEESLTELSELAGAAGLTVVGSTYQRLTTPNVEYYIGPGKVKEITEQMHRLGCSCLVVDTELSPSQQKNLEAAFNKDLLKKEQQRGSGSGSGSGSGRNGEVSYVKVVDRTALILDIFAQHAKTRE
eukprot:gene9498-10499_t